MVQFTSLLTEHCDLDYLLISQLKEETGDVPNTRKAFRQQIYVMLTQSQLNKNNKTFSKV